MKIKLITLTALGALALGSSVLANETQDGAKDRPGGHGGRHRMSLDRMTEQLNLTPEQKAKVQPILDQLKPQLETIHREAMEKSKAVMENAMNQIRPVLTPEQQKKLEEAQNDRRGHRGEHGGHHRGHHGQDGQDEPDDN
jgi:Spy/CpxP family protein refolding chaperone